VSPGFRREGPACPQRPPARRTRSSLRVGTTTGPAGAGPVPTLDYFVASPPYGDQGVDNLWIQRGIQFYYDSYPATIGP
jgi:hypothetical protein